MNSSTRGELIADVMEQVLYLRELGIKDLAVEWPAGVAAAGPPVGVEAHDDDPAIGAPTHDPAMDPRSRDTIREPNAEPPPMPVIATSNNEKAKPRAGSRLSALPPLPKRSPARVDAAVRKADERGNEDMPKTKAMPAAGEALLGEIGPALPETQESIADIRLDVGNCTRCPLHQGRTKIVHTAGNFEADLMFVGEAPGADEDEQGLPFVGRAGQLLTKIIEAIGMSRDQVVIGNINRCRPPANRQPTLPEAHTCRPFLMREIAVIKPKVIVVLGNTAMHNLLDTKVGITKMRGQFHDYFGVKVMPTFHPAYLLRDPSKKREVWEDMKMVKAYLQGDPRA